MNLIQLKLEEFAPDLINFSAKELVAKYENPQFTEGNRKYRLRTNFTVSELIEKLKAANKLNMFLTRPPYHGDDLYFYEQDGDFTVAIYDRSICFEERKFTSIEDALGHFLPNYLANFGISFKKDV